MDSKVWKQMAAMASLGTRFWPCQSRLAIPWAMASYYAWKAPPERGRFVTAGGSDRLGCLGFVEAGLELARQIEAGECPPPGRIYMAAGSAGSGAGLAIGLGLAGHSCRLHLVSAVEGIAFNRWRYRSMLKMIMRELRRLGLRRGLPPTASGLLHKAGVRWTIDHRQVGGGYTKETVAGREAIRLAGRHGLRLESTYTAKCFAALLEDLRAGLPPEEGPILYWNTHGANSVADHIREGWHEGLPPSLQREIPPAMPSLPPPQNFAVGK